MRFGVLPLVWTAEAFFILRTVSETLANLELNQHAGAMTTDLPIDALTTLGAKLNIVVILKCILNPLKAKLIDNENGSGLVMKFVFPIRKCCRPHHSSRISSTYNKEGLRGVKLCVLVRQVRTN